MKLRPYQEAAIRGIKSAIGRGHTSVLVVIPTGGGKTVIFSQLPIELYGPDPVKVLILAHRDELVTQARDKYLASNPATNFGIEKGSLRADPTSYVCAASVQTLKGARLEAFGESWGVPRLIITDEAHHAVAPGYRAIYDHFGSDVYHVGVTATPARGDKVGLETVFTEIAYAVSLEELIESKYLVDICGVVVRTDVNLAGLKRQGGDYKQAELADAVNTDDRNAEIVRAYLDLALGRPAICFTVNVSHSLAITEAFNANGIAAAHLDGTTPDIDRRRILSDLKTGKITVLCNCAVLTEGFDEPKIEVVIMARPTMSAGLFTQCVGRGTRLSEGKDSCLVIDIHDISRHRSCFSLPALFGMPPDFDLKGKSAKKTAEALHELSDGMPIIDEVVRDADMLEFVELMTPAQRLRFLVEAVKSKNGLAYVPVDLLRPRPLPAHLRESTELTWYPVDDTTFRLSFGRESLTVAESQLGQWEVTLFRDQRPPFRLGSSPDLRLAMRRAEQWLRERRPNDVPLLDATKKWRDRPLTGGQRSKLKKLGVKAPRKTDWTAGEGSTLIEQLIAPRGEA